MSKHRDIDFFKHPAAEREWQAQEAAAGLVVAVLEGGSWFHADPAAWSVAGNPWVLALLACLGASQGAEWLRRRWG